MTSTRPGPPMIGRFRLLVPIGEGGMGVVHLAEDENGRRVALKVLRPQVVGDHEGRQRLDREVSSLRQVRSVHVAEVLDADPWGDHPFIVTRYVPGHSLHETVEREGPLPLGDLLHTGRGLLEAVRDVHAAGVLHRDLKPTNVVMEGRSPILIDFGLARLAEDPRLTMTGTVLGTPGYLAPEVLYGDEATPATDVHGWAATTAYAATGRPPYGRGHTMAVLDRTRRGDADLQAVPAPLRDLLAACLSLEPLDRPTLAEAVTELERIADGVGSAEAPTTLLATSAATAPPPDLTMPWQTVPRDEPATEVVATPTPPNTPTTTPSTTPVTPPAPTLVQPPTTIAPTPTPAPYPPPVPVQHPAPAYGPPYRPHGHPRPLPPGPAGHLPPGHAGAPVAPAPGRLDGAGRLRRASLLLGLGLVTVTTYRLAPYVTYAALLVLVAGVRGLARTQESLWRRRTIRGGPRWSDAPRGTLAYPWHVLVMAPVSLLLLTCAAVPTAFAVGVLVLAGSTWRDALLVGGVVTALCLWWGPGSARLRRPLGQGAAALARRPAVGWTAVVLVGAVVVGLLVTVRTSGVEWYPETDSPWEQMRPVLPDAVRRWT